MFIVDGGLHLMPLIIMLSIMMILILKLQFRTPCMSLIVDGGLEWKGLHVVGLLLLFLPDVFQSKS